MGLRPPVDLIQSVIEGRSTVRTSRRTEVVVPARRYEVILVSFLAPGRALVAAGRPFRLR